MLRRVLHALLCLLALMAPGMAVGESVSFASQPQFGPSLTLSGKLSKPPGAGPFPAIVLLHGCSGLWEPWGAVWAERLVAWGYVVLRVESFQPRGYPDGICDRIGAVAESDSADDSHAAKAYLQGLKFVDAGRIGVFGMSHGGGAALLAVQNSYLFEVPRERPFQAAIALYPYCPEVLHRPDAPLLVLIGEADDWTLAIRCQRMTLRDEISEDYTLKIYPEATHAFDVDLPERTYLGHSMRFDPGATQDTIEKIREFLGRHLKNR